MHKNTSLATAAFAVASLALLPPHADADHQSAEVIIEWNQLLQQNIGGPPLAQPRTYAMTHIAMADAVVAIEGVYKPYHVRLRAPPNASAEAAAAQAAHDLLVVLVPTGLTAFDMALQKRLGSIPPGPRSSGVWVGKRVAAAILEWRQNDGFANANPQPPPFLPSTLPGIWRPTASGPAQFSRIGDVEPFGLWTTTQFLPMAMPQLESPEYAEAFNEVKNKGRSTGSTRTAEETRFAQLFASSGPYVNATTPFALWSNVARDVSQDRGYSLTRTARLFALMTASIQDSLITSHTSKFVYRLWRPETAIAHADIDDNAATIAESGWVPLVVTPPYPSHSSNMTCLGAGAARMLANVFHRDAQAFTATWYSTANPPTIVHAQPYTTFSALAHDEALSRIWGGIHFRFEIDASEVSCPQVADYIYDHYMERDRH